MRQRTLGILAAALLLIGSGLGLGAGALSIQGGPTTLNTRPLNGTFPQGRHRFHLGPIGPGSMQPGDGGQPWPGQQPGGGFQP